MLEPGVWDEAYMSKQLAYSGLLEVARVRHAGFAHRRDFDACYGYYKPCVGAKVHKELATKTGRERVTRLLLELRIHPKQYLIGKTVVFLRKNVLGARPP